MELTWSSAAAPNQPPSQHYDRTALYLVSGISADCCNDLLERAFSEKVAPLLFTKFTVNKMLEKQEVPDLLTFAVAVRGKLSG